MTRSQRLISWIKILLILLAFPASVVFAEKAGEWPGIGLLFGMFMLAAVLSIERPKHQAPVLDLRHPKKKATRAMVEAGK